MSANPLGLLLPFQRNASGSDFASGTGAELAISKVLLVLGTAPGEVDWRPDFAGDLRSLRHQNNDLILQAIVVYRVRAAFAAWLPDFYVPPGGVATQRDGRVLRVKVAFNQRSGTGSPVFPRDLTAELAIPMAPASATA